MVSLRIGFSQANLFQLSAPGKLLAIGRKTNAKEMYRKPTKPKSVGQWIGICLREIFIRIEMGQTMRCIYQRVFCINAVEKW